MTAASSRIPQTPMRSIPPTRRPPQRPPSSTLQAFGPPQPPPSSFTTSPRQPQPALSAAQYSERAGEPTTTRPQHWSQKPTVSSSKLPRPAVNTTMAKTQECLGEKHESAGESNQVCKTPRGQGRGQGKRGGRRRPRNGAVRLVSADGLSGRGRVEIFVLSQWGTVCDDLFTAKAGTVVCRQLGFTEALEVKSRAALGAADRSVRILLDDVECEGGERSLLECKRSKIGKHNCSHREDVGVICG